MFNHNVWRWYARRRTLATLYPVKPIYQRLFASSTFVRCSCHVYNPVFHYADLPEIYSGAKKKEKRKEETIKIHERKMMVSLCLRRCRATMPERLSTQSKSDVIWIFSFFSLVVSISILIKFILSTRLNTFVVTSHVISYMRSSPRSSVPPRWRTIYFPLGPMKC